MNPFKSNHSNIPFQCLPPQQLKLSGFHEVFSQPWTAIDALIGLKAGLREKRFISSAETNATS
jgi:hypothetical protein